MSRTQLNVRVGNNLHKRIAQDRQNTLATKDIIVEVALENWFSVAPSQREKFYKAHNRRPYAKAA